MNFLRASCFSKLTLLVDASFRPTCGVVRQSPTLLLPQQ
jgi:hypothetical protein